VVNDVHGSYVCPAEKVINTDNNINHERIDRLNNNNDIAHNDFFFFLNESVIYTCAEQCLVVANFLSL